MGDARLGRHDTERVRRWGMDEREFQMGKAVMGTGGTTQNGNMDPVGGTMKVAIVHSSISVY